MGRRNFHVIGIVTGFVTPLGSYCELLILQVPGLSDARGVTVKSVIKIRVGKNFS